MENKLQSKVTCAYSIIAALILLLAGIFEVQRGGSAMAAMAFLGMVCALVIACHSHDPVAPEDRMRGRLRA